MTAGDRLHDGGLERGPGQRSRRLFAAFAVPNLRLYLAGQAISLPARGYR
jgi:hypothetical protein